jgi:hypothetical protein
MSTAGLEQPAGSPTGARPGVIAREFVELFSLWHTLDWETAESTDARTLSGDSRRAGAARQAL